MRTFVKTANNLSVLLSSFSSLKVYFFFSAVKHISEQFEKSCKQAYKSLKCPPLGLLPWQSPSLGYAKKGRVGRLSRWPSGHEGCSVPMNRWTNAGGSIDGHFPIAWRVSYKRVYLRMKAGDAIDASIPMHEEGCMPRHRAEYESASACEEWVNWMNVSATRLWYVSFECERRSYRRALSRMRPRTNWCLESFGGHCKASAVCDQE